MRITTTKTKKGRINVLADGEYSFTVYPLLWAQSKLYEGCEATEEQLMQLKQEGERQDAYENAVKYLSYRAHCQKELIRKLKQKYPEEACLWAVERCMENGYVNDGEYAKNAAEYLYRQKHYSANRITQDLTARGIEYSLIRDALEELMPDKAEGICAILNKIHYDKETADEKQRARAIRRLLSMGYSLHDIKKYMDCPEDYE